MKTVEDKDFKEFQETMASTIGVVDPTLLDLRSTFHPAYRCWPNESTRALISGLPRLKTDSRERSQAFSLGPLLGTGGMGQVRTADQLAIGRQVAIKSLRKESHDHTAVLQLLREAWVTGRLEHPNIVPIYSLGADSQGGPMIVMKHIEGILWQDYLLGKRPLAPEDAADPLGWHLRILMQVCNAVQFAASKGIVHRDLKPDNVMIGSFGEVYVLDWGIAVSLHPQPDGRLLTVQDVEQTVAGTPGYMAPEMVGRKGLNINDRTDIYLLGAILHEIITGRRRHLGRTLMDTLFSSYKSEPFPYEADVPDELARIANRSMARDPQERFENAEQFKQALTEFLNHRHSADLATEAARGLKRCRARLATSAPDYSAINRQLNECKYGFKQALREWPENPDAMNGLQDSLELMLQHELRQEDYETAFSLYSELPRASSSLKKALIRLDRKKSERQKELKTLQRIQADRDLDTGQQTRARFCVSMATGLSVGPLAVGLVELILNTPVTASAVVFAYTLLALTTLILVISMRDDLLGTAVNRQLTSAVFMGLTAVMGTKLMAAVTGMTLTQTMSMDFVIYMLLTALCAMTIDLALIRGLFAYFAGLLVALVYPQYMFFIHGAAHLLAFSLFAMSWRSQTGGDQRVLKRMVFSNARPSTVANTRTS